MYTFLMESQRYGKFSSFAKFIESYEAEQLLLAKKERARPILTFCPLLEPDTSYSHLADTSTYGLLH